MFQLRLFHDVYNARSAHTSKRPVPHSIFYLYQGSAEVDGTSLAKDQAQYVSEYVPVVAGPDGATIWRWELIDRDAPLGVVEGEGITSRLRMARDVKMFELVPSSSWLFRLDKIIGFEDTTGMHAHAGSGIRCLLEGNVRTESRMEGDTENGSPGDVWYEEGSYPLVSSVDPGVKATFLRGMVLPPEYTNYADSATWISGQPEGGARFAGWQEMARELVTLR